MKIITVPEGGKDIVRLGDAEIVTYNLEACVAIAGKIGDNLALMHLTQISPLRKMFDWFTGQVPTNGSSIYGIGGMQGKSEHFVRTLEIGLREKGYSNFGWDVLGPYRRNLQATEIGFQVEYFRQWMDGSREIRCLPVGRRTIPYFI